MPVEDIAHADWPEVSDDERLPRDPMVALDRLTQLNGPDRMAAAHACGAISLVAATVAMRGYAGLPRLAASLGDELSDETCAALRRLADDIALGGDGATYGALATFSHVLQRRYRGFDGGMPYDKLLHLMKEAGFHPPRFLRDDNIGATVTRAGQCWPAKIALHSDHGDHWILVGRNVRGLFIYDPWPREDASQIVRPGEADWRKYAEAVGEDEVAQDTIGFLPRE
jgi:hypothetical protein